MPKAIRLRTLILAGGLAAVSLATVLAYVVVGRAVEGQLALLLPPDQVAAAVQAARGAILAASALSLCFVVPVCLWLGGLIARPLVALRAAVHRLAGGEPAPEAPPPAISELGALAAALARLGEEHRRSLAPLAKERSELALLIDSVGEGIVQTGPNGRIVRANRTARAMLNLPVEAQGQPVATLIRHGELRRALESVALGQAVAPFEVALEDRRILVVARPLGDRTAPGSWLGAVAIFMDLTEVRRLEGVRRDFVANASHELKTPLTSIRGYSETLLTDELPPDLQRRFLETIHQNAERLQQIVDDLLDLSRLESGRWRPDLKVLSPAEVAGEAWEGLRDKAAPKRIAFSVEGAASALVLADPVGLRQIFSNLIDNAIRYTPPDGRIVVRVSEAGGVVVEVKDNGSGIPRDALPRLFERFYRVDPARSRAEGGTGLGLAIVKHLVESMGGDVVAESESGKGTTIRIRLPAAQRLAAPALPTT